MKKPVSPGPDLYFAGGECLTRFGVLVRRTEPTAEDATHEIFTRNSLGMLIRQDGVLDDMEEDFPRVEWLDEGEVDPTRNLLFDTDPFSTAYFTVGAARTPYFVDKRLPVTLTEDDTNGNHDLEVDVGSSAGQGFDGDFVPNTIYTFSCYAKSANRFLALRTTNLAGTTATTYFNLFLGIIGADPHPSSQMEDVGGGWYRCSVQFNSSSGVSGTALQYRLADANNVFTYQGDGVSSLLIDRPQLEIAALPSTFQATPRDLTRKFPSLLLEGLKVNHFTFSEEVDNAAWIKIGIDSVSANSQRAPDGTGTADLLTEDALVSDHKIERTLEATIDNIDQTLSFFARAAGRTWVYIRTDDKSGGVGRTWFRVAADDGRIGTVDPLHNNVEITRLDFGWYRLSLRFNVAAGGGTPFGTFGMATDDGVSSYQGTNSTIYMWGMQHIRDSSVGSSYIPSGGVFGQREPDDFSSVYLPPPQPMRLYLKWLESGTFQAGSNSPRLFSLSDVAGETGPYLRCFSTGSSNAVRVDFHDGVITNTVQTGSNLVPLGFTTELLVELFSDGTLGITLASGGEVVSVVARAGTPVVLPPVWGVGSPLMRLDRATSNQGFERYLAVKNQRGVGTGNPERDLAFMRNL